mmetsp:Transcript_27396/g.75337  ORF Transcript_27396/g.75337 Transcript_27396/m.75337 type:complete len:293 (-) Transcript_27396:229-1107(-)
MEASVVLPLDLATAERLGENVAELLVGVDSGLFALVVILWHLLSSVWLALRLGLLGLKPLLRFLFACLQSLLPCTFLVDIPLLQQTRGQGCLLCGRDKGAIITVLHVPHVRVLLHDNHSCGAAAVAPAFLLLFRLAEPDVGIPVGLRLLHLGDEPQPVVDVVLLLLVLVHEAAVVLRLLAQEQPLRNVLGAVHEDVQDVSQHLPAYLLHLLDLDLPVRLADVQPLAILEILVDQLLPMHCDGEVFHREVGSNVLGLRVFPHGHLKEHSLAEVTIVVLITAISPPVPAKVVDL